MTRPTVLELCAGGGGQALGLERAGFEPVGLVEIEAHACETLRTNRPHWPVIAGDIHAIHGRQFEGVDLVAGGVPCPPFSIAGKQLGSDDERDLFPAALRIIEQARPAAIMLENVRGLASKRFDGYRTELLTRLSTLGYDIRWRVLNASDYGVPQLRPRFLLVGIRHGCAPFAWPEPSRPSVTVGDALWPQMSEGGWKGAAEWRRRANRIAPTIVGGSKKHGGPDLGPTRARREWQALGVDGRGIAAEPPGPDFPRLGLPRLTVPMVAVLQGFPREWQFSGGKTAAYRQVGNAFPPPVARAAGAEIAHALGMEGTGDGRRTRPAARLLLEERRADSYIRRATGNRGDQRVGAARPGIAG